MARTFNVLFLCTGNSARSIIAESLLNHMANGAFRGFSAGSHPSGTINLVVLRYLREKGVSTEDARSKGWEEFAAPGAPVMDFVITVCDSAAGEVCPIWPGHPVTAHWGLPDPAAHMHDPAIARTVVEQVFQTLRARISLLMSLPVEKLERLALQSRVRDIARQA